MNKTLDVLSLQKFYVYLLYSLKDHRFYVGFTSDLKQRMNDHFNGSVIATKNRLPLKLIHYEYFINRHDTVPKKWLWKKSDETDFEKNAH